MLFDLIAPVYGLFYEKQRSKFTKAIKRAKPVFDITTYNRVLDVGCGTGALLSVLYEKGLSVSGVEPSEKMLKIAKKNNINNKIEIKRGDVLKKLPFDDRSFDIVITSYVAHGMKSSNRIKMYKEMSRVASHLVIIYDYNKKRSVLTNTIEFLEGGNYFSFIKRAGKEMKYVFENVETINVDKKASWYICVPKTN